MKYVILFLIGCMLFMIMTIEIPKLVIQMDEVEAKMEVELIENLTIEFNDKKKVSDFIVALNGTIVNDYIIDSTVLGKQIVSFEYINEYDTRLAYSFEIDVVDTVGPVIWLSDAYFVKRGSKDTLMDDIICGDNVDSNPTCEIVGEYNLKKRGVYPLTFKATDFSGNVTEQPFILYVYETYMYESYVFNSTKSNSKIEIYPDYIKFADVVKKHKTNKTKIGIDVSGYQGTINFEKLKQAGVEFIIIKVGGTLTPRGGYYVDSQFIRNIKGANEAGIDVGLYLFSYADSKEQAINEANWLLEQIEGYDVTLPIAFDWENWEYYNTYNLSFYELTSMAEAFIDTVEEAGYQGMLYSSKSYLEKIWLPIEHDIWLAHYTSQTNYQGEYKFWQLCDNGLVDGINGFVDINILYE